MNCLNAIHNHEPYDRTTDAGLKAALVKRALIGLIATVAISVGFYFAQRAWFTHVWNPWNYSINAQIGVSIGSAVFVGSAALVIFTIYIFHITQKNYPSQRNL